MLAVPVPLTASEHVNPASLRSGVTCQSFGKRRCITRAHGRRLLVSAFRLEQVSLAFLCPSLQDCKRCVAPQADGGDRANAGNDKHAAPCSRCAKLLINILPRLKPQCCILKQPRCDGAPKSQFRLQQRRALVGRVGAIHSRWAAFSDMLGDDSAVPPSSPVFVPSLLPRHCRVRTVYGRICTLVCGPHRCARAASLHAWRCRRQPCASRAR